MFVDNWSNSRILNLYIFVQVIVGLSHKYSRSWKMSGTMHHIFLIFFYHSKSYILFVTSKIDMLCFCCSSIPFFYSWIGWMPVFLPKEDYWEYKRPTFPCQFCLWFLAGKYLFPLPVLRKYYFSNINISGG